MYASLDNHVRSRLRLRHLELLELIGDGCSVHTAAARLSLTQPAASKLLQDIEEIYGAKLFHRRGRKLCPTRSGDAAITWARETLRTVSHSISDVRLIESGRSGLVRVGTMTVSAPQILVRSIAALLKTDPSLKIHVVDGGAQTLMQTLAREELDLLLVRVPPLAHQPPFAFESLYGLDQMCLICRRGHELVNRPNPDLASLANTQWIFPPEPAPIRVKLMQRLSQANAAFRGSTIETSSLALLTELVASTDMVAPLPLHVATVQASSAEFEILPFPVDVELPPIGFVWNKFAPVSPACEKLKDAVRAVTRHLSVLPHSSGEPSCSTR